MNDTLAVKYLWMELYLVKSIQTDFIANLLVEVGKSDKNKQTNKYI